MEMEDGTHIPFPDLFLIVSRTKEGQHHPVSPKGRLDDIGYISHILAIIKIS